MKLDSFPHPKYPLQEAEQATAEIVLRKHLSNLITSEEAHAELLHLHAQFDAARDTLHPGWRDAYDRRVRAWMERRSGPPGRTVEWIVEHEINISIVRREGVPRAPAA